MTKPLRSPVRGYNHNIRHRGRVYHVQTEDSFPANAWLFTHLFFGGTILASKKQEYDPEVAEGVVKSLMQAMHKAMLRELTHGGHDDKIAPFFAALGEEPFPGPAEEAQAEATPPPVSTAEAVPEYVPTLAPEDIPTPPPVVAMPPPRGPRRITAEVVTPPPVPRARPPSEEAIPRRRQTRPVAPMLDTSRVSSTPVPVAPGIPVVVTGRSSVAGPADAGPAQPPRRSTRPVISMGGSDKRRPPVVMGAGAVDGVVVQRNVVIGVGGRGTAPAPPTAPPAAPARPATPPARYRPPVPYVVREGSYPVPPGTLTSQSLKSAEVHGEIDVPTPPPRMGGYDGLGDDGLVSYELVEPAQGPQAAAYAPEPTESYGRGAAPHIPGSPGAGPAPQPLASGRELRMPWDQPNGPAPGGNAHAGHAASGAARDIRMPWDQPAPPARDDGGAPMVWPVAASDGGFGSGLPGDKSLDEVILEYLADENEDEQP